MRSLQGTLSTGLLAKMADTPYDVSRAILRHGEGVDILPANIELSGVEVTMVNAMSREKILKQTLEPLKEKYDHILLDCIPSLSMLTVNALTEANSVVIPVQAQYLSAKGLEQLLGTIAKVRRQINCLLYTSQAQTEPRRPESDAGRYRSCRNRHANQGLCAHS